jgi:hypothetical protein
VATKLEVFFDVSSPWTYLGFEGIQPIAQALGVPVEWRPILVGGVFNTVNPSVYHSREHPVPPKQDYLRKDLGDWARAYGLRINHPPTVFPVNSVIAMRACIVAAREGKLVDLARAAFRRYWSEDEDISTEPVHRAVRWPSLGDRVRRRYRHAGRRAARHGVPGGPGGLGWPPARTSGHTPGRGLECLRCSRQSAARAALAPGGLARRS